MNRFLTPEHLQKLNEEIQYLNMCFEYYNRKLTEQQSVKKDVDFLFHQREVIGKRLLRLTAESEALEDYLQ